MLVLVVTDSFKAEVKLVLLLTVTPIPVPVIIPSVLTVTAVPTTALPAVTAPAKVPTPAVTLLTVISEYLPEKLINYIAMPFLQVFPKK